MSRHMCGYIKHLLVKNLRTHRVHMVETRFPKYLTTECGYDGIDFPEHESFSVFRGELDSKVTCKTCRKVLGLAPLSEETPGRKQMNITPGEFYKDYERLYNNAIAGGIKYLKDYPKVKGFVVGISGGIDSLLSVMLARAVIDKMNNELDVFAYRLIGYSLPILTNEHDEISRARETGELFCTNFTEVNLLKTYLNLVPDVDRTLYSDVHGYKANRSLDSKIRAGNIKARLRMIYLYDRASEYNSIVLSTDNYTEYLLGFWTLHGDVGDFGFIQNLWKTEVYGLVEWINQSEVSHPVIEDTLEAKPTDGLGVSDSDLSQLLPEWGGSYRAGYKYIDKLLVSHVNGSAYAALAINMKGPVLARHLATEFKRDNPFNLSREQLIR